MQASNFTRSILACTKHTQSGALGRDGNQKKRERARTSGKRARKSRQLPLIFSHGRRSHPRGQNRTHPKTPFGHGTTATCLRHTNRSLALGGAHHARLQQAALGFVDFEARVLARHGVARRWSRHSIGGCDLIRYVCHRSAGVAPQDGGRPQEGKKAKKLAPLGVDPLSLAGLAGLRSI